MPQPAMLNLKIYQGDTFNRNFQVVRKIDGVETPIDLSEHVALAQVRLKPTDEDTIASFTVTYVDEEQGRVNLFMSDEDTALLPRICYYDFQTEDSVSGDVKTWFAGRIDSDREVSRLA